MCVCVVPPIGGFIVPGLRGVLGGLLLKLLVATEVLVEADLDEDEVALLALEIARVR